MVHEETERRDETRRGKLAERVSLSRRAVRAGNIKSIVWERPKLAV